MQTLACRTSQVGLSSTRLYTCATKANVCKSHAVWMQVSQIQVSNTCVDDTSEVDRYTKLCAYNTLELVSGTSDCPGTYTM